MRSTKGYKAWCDWRTIESRRSANGTDIFQTEYLRLLKWLLPSKLFKIYKNPLFSYFIAWEKAKIGPRWVHEDEFLTQCHTLLDSPGVFRRVAVAARLFCVCLCSSHPSIAKNENRSSLLWEALWKKSLKLGPYRGKLCFGMTWKYNNWTQPHK